MTSWIVPVRFNDWQFRPTSALCGQDTRAPRTAKREIALLSTEVASSAISNLSTTEVVSKMAAWLGQAQAANLYSDKQSAVDAFRSARDPFLLTSHPLRDIQLVFTNLTFLAERGAFRLFFWWLSSTAGYVPGNEAQLSLSDMAPLRRVLPKGCYPFLSGRSEKISQSFPSKPFGFSAGRQ